MTFAGLVGFQEQTLEQQTHSVEGSRIEERMGEALSRVEELQQRINDAHAQLQAFISQFEEAAPAVQNSVRLASSLERSNEPALERSAVQRDGAFALSPGRCSIHTETTCIWRPVRPNPQVSLAYAHANSLESRQDLASVL